jgi:hypothetical protein
VKATPRPLTKSVGGWLLFAAILIPACLGFSMKFKELLLLSGNDDGAFAVMPVVSYLVTTVGFFFLLIYATLSGMFRNIEGPKYKMLETERELDEEERELERDSEFLNQK